MPSQTEIQKQITDRILEGLKAGCIPWRKTWRPDKNSGAPANAISSRSYSGINPILLDLVAMSRGYTSRFWATYDQWTNLGAQVRKRPADCKPGQWGTQIVFYQAGQENQDRKRRREDRHVSGSSHLHGLQYRSGGWRNRSITCGLQPNPRPSRSHPDYAVGTGSNCRNWCRHPVRR